ncbi:retrovirus-related pol polyprotein from transposon TNT 1-94 [Tanacetum coccineum]|uniref:Retrovirus-related pol polyprotein from transposon TNT 1-94 n=1 Tax=Tanacetum coccineum TaxID=301880 RepID=A0ABQ5CF80_9ASTR
MLITHQGNSQVKHNKIDLLVQQYGQFIISEDESINSAFARFNTIITSLKALDEGYSSKNYVRKFLRDLHPKWRAKVTSIEESKDLTSLSLDELIGNLKVHEMIIKKDSKIVKVKVERKSITLKAKKESSDEEYSTSGSETKSTPWRCGDPNHLFRECPKPPKDKNQRAFVGGSWSDSGEEDDEKVKDETCLVAHASSEICLGVNLEPDEWIKDSVCSKHMTGNQKLFSTYKAYNRGNVIFGSNLRGNIISKGQICDNKCRVTFSVHDSEITKDGKVICRGKQAHVSHKAKNIVSTTRCLELLHMDLFSPSAVWSYAGNCYTLVIVDDYSRKVEESLNVTFDETPPPSKTSLLVDDDLDKEDAFKVTEKKNLENDIVDETLEIDETINIKESRNQPLKNVIGNLNQRTLRLVAQGYNQQEDIDYDETYALVAILESIRILLAYACALNFKLFQMDVKTAFLNGFINEEAYVAQPPGFIDFEKPDHVYKLKKALNGLKQAPKDWHDILKSFFIKHEYKIGMVCWELRASTRRNKQRRTLFTKEMDLETTQTNAVVKLPLLKQGEYEMWRLRIEQYLQIQDYALWDIIENGNSFNPVARTTTNTDGTSTSTIPGPVTTEEKTQKKNDVKARSMLLMALPNEHQLTFNQYKDAKTLFATIQTRFGGNDNTKKTQKTLLKQMNKPDLDSISFDDLYNNFKIVEQEVKRTVTSSSNSGSQNVAFVSTHDLEEMDLKWQLALLSMRARRYYQRIRKKITINGSDTAGYDKSKVECFNCHKMGHFARECRGPRNQKSRARNQDSSRRTVNVEETSSKAMVAIDGAGFEWSYMADEEVPTNLALMVFLDSEVHNNKTCSNTCLKSFETLETQLDNLRVEFNKSEFNLATYKRGLASVEEQFLFYKKNEVIFCDQIAVLKRYASFKDSKINALNIQIEKLKKEKESNQIKIDNFENASKSLDKLIGGQIYDNNRKGMGYNAVPPPPTGLFAPPTIDLSNSGLKEFQQPEFEGYGFKANKGICENSSNEVKKSLDSPIIEDRVSDCDEDESEVNSVNTAKINSVNTAKGNRVTSASGEQGFNAVKSSACWVWRPKIKADSSLELKGYLINNGYADLVKMLHGWS